MCPQFNPLGRVHRQSPKNSAAATTAQSRLNRRNNAKQAQAQKRHALVNSGRIFGGVNGAPRIVAVIPLTEDVDTRGVISSLAGSLDNAPIDLSEQKLWTLKYVYVLRSEGRIITCNLFVIQSGPV